MAKISEAYFNSRIGPLLMLGVGSGLAYTLCTDTLQGWLTHSDVALPWLGFASLISLPFSFKFLWAPLMDRYTPPLLGRRRGWLLLMQVLIAGCLLAMSAVGTANLWVLGSVAVGLALAGASQDVVGDAYRADLLQLHERGAGAAAWVMGWRIGFGLFSGLGAFYCVGRGWISWPTAYVLMAVSMLLPMAGTLLGPEPAQTRQMRAPGSLLETFGEPLRRFIMQRDGWLVLAFVLVFKAPESLANQMTIPFLGQGVGFTDKEIGLVRQGFGVIIMIAGTLVGGGMTARLNLRVCLWICGVLHGVSNLSFLLLIRSGANVPALFAVVGVENFIVGLTTAVFVAFLTGQCDPRYSATQYALLSGVMALSRTACSVPSGLLAQKVGWTWYFVLSMLTMLPGLMLIMWVPLGSQEAEELAPASQ